MKKLTVIAVLVLALVCSLTACSGGISNREARESFARSVIAGEIAVPDGGSIDLDGADLDLSDRDECVLVDYRDRQGILFFDFAGGILGDSRVSIYLLNESEEFPTEKLSTRYSFSNEKTVDDRWVTCSASD